MARPQKLTPIEKIGIQNAVREGIKKEQLAVENNVSVRTIDRILKEVICIDNKQS